MRDPLTVVVPLYNGASFIGATLDSLAAQTVQPHEVIVVDDGSTDDGPEIARCHSVAPHMIRQANAGVAVARNRGALAATSRYIAFLDQDDLWLPRRHERILAYLNEHADCSALATPERRFYLAADQAKLEAMDEGLHKTAERVPDSQGLVDLYARCGDENPLSGTPQVTRTVDTRELLGGTITVTCSFVFERELFLAAGGCVVFARTMDDWLAILNISRLTTIPMLDEPSILYRIHPASTTMAAQWPLPLLTALAAVRFGGTLVPAGHGRDPQYVSLSLFWRHWLLALARSNRTGLLDAIALTRLLASSDEKPLLVTLQLIKTGIRAKLRRLMAR
jgi:glycosyltransferase involved in cell wall biosynthesis